MSSNLATVRALEQKAAAMQGSLEGIAQNEVGIVNQRPSD